MYAIIQEKMLQYVKKSLEIGDYYIYTYLQLHGDISLQKFKTVRFEYNLYVN